MNLIELSNNLKDVPDHYLMNEVRQPTGAYPAYLVISELTRRKGMRDRALKNDPKSTVVEDLTQPNREQMMSAVAQMQQQPMPQQQPLPPQMPPQMPLPPQMPPAGLMATPQASSLAATDAVASPRKRMAGGGLVAFQEGGDVKRFAGDDGSYVRGDPRYSDTSTPFGFLFNSQDEAVANLAVENKKRKAREAAALARGELPVAETVSTKSGPTIPTSIKTPVADNVAKPTASVKPAAPAAALAASGADPFAAYYPKALPTEEEFTAAQQRQTERYNKDVPDRFTGTDKELSKRDQYLKDRRKSAQNEALMMAGIGMLKSKSPGRWLGEGGEEGMLAYRQSMKDVRGGEDAMTQARQDLAKSQLLQDQARYSAGQAGRQNMLDQYKAALEGQQVGGGLAAKRMEIEQKQQVIPSEIAQNYGLANLYTAKSGAQGEDSPTVLAAQIRAAQASGKTDPKLLAAATQNLIMRKIFPSPANKAEYDQLLAAEYQRLMGLAGASAQPAAQAPVRGEAQGAR